MEEEHRLGKWMERYALGRRLLSAKDWLDRRYFDHIDRYHQESQGFYRFWTRAGMIVLLLATVAIVYAVVSPHYRRYQEVRGQRQAEQFMKRGDYRNAALCARQALMLNPSNVPACRVMATIADLEHSPNVLSWQARIVAAEPSIENKLMLAAAGLRYQKPPFPLTTQILADLPAVATNDNTYQVIAASLALENHQFAQAENHFASAAQLEPTNLADTLNLAILRMGMTNEDSKTASRETLVKLSGDRMVGTSALRALVVDRLGNQDLAGANKYSLELLGSGQASLADRLQHLGILRRLTNDSFASELTNVLQQSGTNASEVGQVSAWMLANGMAAENIQWLTALPDNVRAQQTVELALANGYLEAREWRPLRDFASQGNWNSLEFLRFALVSHAYAGMGMRSEAEVNWSAAVNEADNSAEPLVRLTKLAELAESWRLNLEKEDLLEQIVQRYPRERWAQAALTDLYFSEGKTAAINHLSAKLNQLFPREPVLENNLAATGMLLQTNLSRAFQLAAEAYTNSPGNPNEATTYAYALHLQGRDSEGLAVLQKLPQAQLKDPSVALYYGLLLTANGRHDEAQSWLQIAHANHSLLPEEKRLLASALGE